MIDYLEVKNESRIKTYKERGYVMFIPKNKVTEIKDGDELVYKNGAKRLITRVIREKDEFTVYENYDSKVDRYGTGFLTAYLVKNGKVVLPDDAKGIERETIGAEREEKLLILSDLCSDLGVEDCAKVLHSLCEGCPLKAPCDKRNSELKAGVRRCHSFNAIVGMMTLITIELMPKVARQAAGPAFVKRLKKVIANREGK